MLTKKDLKTGMVVEFKNGDRYMVINDTVCTPEGTCDGVFISNDGWMPFQSYNDNLECNSLSEFDIKVVYKPRVFGLNNMLEQASEIIWERNKEVDWSKVPVDTKVLVKFPASNDWHKRHFAYYKDGKVYTFAGGNTSFTTNSTISWEFAKLYKEDEDV